MADESVHLKTLQTILIIFQSNLQPDNEENMAHALGICLRLLESRSSDNVRNTAAATFRQAVALIFDRVISAESLPAGKFGSGGYISRTNSVTNDVNHNINRLESLEQEVVSGGSSLMRDTLTESGELGLCLLEDLTTLAAGYVWIHCQNETKFYTLLSPNWCGLCRIEQEDQDHLLLHCSFTKELWSRVLQELGVQWIFPEKANEMFILEPSLPLGRKSRCLWFVIVHCLFWSIWLERNSRIFNDQAAHSDYI